MNRGWSSGLTLPHIPNNHPLSDESLNSLKKLDANLAAGIPTFGPQALDYFKRSGEPIPTTSEGARHFINRVAYDDIYRKQAEKEAAAREQAEKEATARKQDEKRNWLETFHVKLLLKMKNKD